MMPLALPVEIWERVIDYLWNWPVFLAMCALVCRAWHARSSGRLVTLTMLVNSRQTYHFARRLDIRPELRARVNLVFICDVLSVHDIDAPKRRPMLHFGTFASMLAKKLPAVKSLKIAEAEWTPAATHRNILLHLSAFASISELILDYVTFPSNIVLARFICALPNLQLLHCASVVCRTKASNPSLFCASATQVKKIILEGTSDDVASLLALQPGTTSGLEEFWVGWTMNAQDTPSNEAITAILQSAGPTIRCVEFRLRQPPGATAEEVRSASAEASHPRLTLQPCTVLEVFSLTYCMPVLSSESITAKLSQGFGWMYAILTSIMSMNMRCLRLAIDVRHITDTNAYRLIERLQEFLDKEQCTRIDRTFVGDPRFKGLTRVDICLLCNPERTSTDAESWKELVIDRFPQLHTHGVLHASVTVRV
ncbi:hypothetical protein DAEQUDRAFT_686856 [Daedalea quercina L-15889]|uniref:F-box domain-containing protein n=1 Tax=Daedalea quercina L-15889 TaxID=1314783 RepID=A0A165SGY8_9APHY|nr:hypothetical protein DAEQUDRAFT_686856 [Daedalea quercina L-15889]